MPRPCPRRKQNAGADPDNAEYRRVSALVQRRPPGQQLLGRRLRLDSGDIVLVNRGFASGAPAERR